MRALAFLLALLIAPAAAAGEFAPAEIARLLRHGPWPPAPATDASNRASGNPLAARLGATLFFERRLSGDGTMSCASCHDPAKAWTDGRPVSVGRGPLDRNAPSLFDVGGRRWYGWDGASDSLWAASLRPILAPRELAGSVAG
ncbi:MAG: cytochrome-c peroxidase, partial [Rhodospirillales bacterium]|nr:cytochrome-c peroxidase [Rhodospirillales bacterium]